MNEQLQKALAEILTKVTSGVEAGVGFLQAELPDVVHQLLMWKLVEAGVGAAFCTTLLVIIVVVMVKYSGMGERIEGSSRRKITLTHDEDGDLSPHIMFTYGVATFLTPFILITAYSEILLCLKIYIAPKIYLIEYAASLTK